ncbi:DUF6522 family protein [Methylobacterium sp. J-026]|uniref:DUF6522 family protein n=1 Tax=Methylobacterium sp. J-026 TaxID=2836624 RepID=UPI001FB91A12|nr:DUF6522 family protein [Methylobacterium sp. J-026]MCJ2138396.1 DUF6522 family protein [Methylobacterium sp. J-026]
MRLDLDEQGGWLIRPDELAQRLRIDEQLLRREAALGRIESRLDRGHGRDEGRSRVTVTVGKHSWQGTFGADGILIAEFRWERHSSAMAVNRENAGVI